MDLIHNATFRLLKELEPSTPYEPGIYRVILDEPMLERTISVLIQTESETHSPKGGRKKQESTKRKRRKAPLPLVGKLIWMDRQELVRLEDEHLLRPIKLSREGLLLNAELKARSDAEHRRRVAVMASFLDFKKLQEGILVHEGLGGLVNQAVKQHKVSRYYVYKNWSNLCRYGLEERSLILRWDRCGAPGVARPCDPGGRRKPGRKTLKERVALAFGRQIPPDQPGMSTEWRAAILAADKHIPTPKPSWSTRCTAILESGFIAEGQEVDGKIVFVKPQSGECPNDRQIQRVLTVEKSRLERLLEKTTKAHFKGSLRGLVARNWRDVSGPNHTWLIDSTVGDVYLRSSLNPAWIVGRPIVYVIVDAWSTAVVGFYVCLSGPSWDMAKVALFNCAADPHLLGTLWGYQPVLTLSPQPTLCYELLCDRGEYLSQGHRQTALRLIPHTGYTPPYRGDLKGLVEVLHRVEKDAQFNFIPGAMDFRREEMELRRVDPRKSVMTVRQYVEYLHELFAEYNLTAPRHDRVDAHMIAAGVHPSPAGLWRWGFEMGIGYRKDVDEADLIDTFLPQSTARVRRDAVRFAKCDYSSPEVREAQWTTLARQFEGWNLPVCHYPGSMSTIWTPNVAGVGMLRLSLSDQTKASPEVSFEELLDSLAYETMMRPQIAHDNRMLKVEFLRRRKLMVERATLMTKEALQKASGPMPTMTEARAMERSLSPDLPSSTAIQTEAADVSDSSAAHRSLINSLLASVDEEDRA